MILAFSNEEMSIPSAGIDAVRVVCERAERRNGRSLTAVLEGTLEKHNASTAEYDTLFGSTRPYVMFCLYRVWRNVRMDECWSEQFAERPWSPSFIPNVSRHLHLKIVAIKDTLLNRCVQRGIYVSLVKTLSTRAGWCMHTHRRLLLTL